MVLSMMLFSLVLSISPGPVNLVALTCGFNNGLLRSIPFVSGSTLGFVTLLFATGMGLGEISLYLPSAYDYLKYLGCGYLLYLALAISTSKVAEPNEDPRSNTFSFSQGWLMQWLNPKAWVACLAGCSAFGVYESDTRFSLFIGIYLVICFVGIASWALLGSKMNSVLRSHRHIKLFNKLMGLILAVLATALLFS
ncbi:LysE family translocator [Alteromonas sp. KUL49]|nr:LysE family translocator [Alteromonas sp. KUL49]